MVYYNVEMSSIDQISNKNAYIKNFYHSGVPSFCKDKMGILTLIYILPSGKVGSTRSLICILPKRFETAG